MRSFSALVKSALSGATVYVRWIARGYLSGGTYAASDAPDDMVWDNGAGALTYLGLASAFQVALPPSTLQNKPAAATLSLSGTDPAGMASLFADPYRNAPADVCLLFNDPVTGLPAEELLMARGVFDVASISDSAVKPMDLSAPQISTLSLTVTPKTVDLDRVGVRLATDVDQRLHRDANDGFFQDVALAAASQINWGIAGSNSPSGANPAGSLSAAVRGAVSSIRIMA